MIISSEWVQDDKLLLPSTKSLKIFSLDYELMYYVNMFLIKATKDALKLMHPKIVYKYTALLQASQSITATLIT